MLLKFHLIYIFIFIENSMCVKSCYRNGVHALILARGGSKGIKDKNLVNVNGISILAQTIITIKKTGLFESIWVSTDSKNIQDEAIKYGAIVHQRPSIYAQDGTSSLESVKEFLAYHHTITKFALFQCTSIFLRERYIVEAFDTFKEKDCVFAITRSHKLRWMKTKSGIIPINFNPAFRPRRQDWDGEMIETGMFYFSTRDLINQNTFQHENCAVVEIDASDSLELDTLNDLLIARCLVKINV